MRTTEVAILVLVDYPFGVVADMFADETGFLVAILVLVDYPFGAGTQSIQEPLSIMVAILVLVDYPFGADTYIFTKSVLNCRNPCSSGLSFRRAIANNLSYVDKSRNPCSSGLSFRRHYNSDREMYEMRSQSLF